MSSARLMGMVAGGMFSGAVARAEQAAPAAKPRELRDDRYMALADFRAGDDETQKEVSALITERIQSNRRIETFLAKQAEREYNELIEKHEQMKEICRELLDAIAAKKMAQLQEENRWHAARAASSAAAAKWQQARAQAQQFRALLKPRSDIAEADADAVDLEHAIPEFEAREGAVHARYIALGGEIAQLSEQLRKAEAAERNLSCALGECAMTSLGLPPG